MLNIEELTLIKMYGGLLPDRDRVIAALNDALPFIEEGDIQETARSTIRKANAMTREAFGGLDLSETLDGDE